LLFCFQIVFKLLSATYEALLSPEQNRGTGAMVTMFYDTASHVASFTVQLGGIRSARLGID